MLPKSTEFNKKIPKSKFHQSIEKNLLQKEVKAIYWKNKIAPTTLNILPGVEVEEIEIFHLILHKKDISNKILEKIDKSIPYHIVFLLEYEEEYRHALAYKKIEKDKITLEKYYTTEWSKNIDLNIVGLTLDEVYENLVHYIAGNKLKKEKDKTLDELVEDDKRRQNLQKQIATLATKLRREKQLNRKMELNSELKKLKRKLEE